MGNLDLDWSHSCLNSQIEKRMSKEDKPETFVLTRKKDQGSPSSPECWFDFQVHREVLHPAESF